MLTVRPATIDDCIAWIGGQIEEWAAVQPDGYVALRDGKVVAIGIVTRHAPDWPGAWGWFSRHEAVPAITMHRLAKRAMAKLRARGDTIMQAACDEHVPGSEKWLRRLGFRPAPEQTTDPNHPVWICDLSNS